MPSPTDAAERRLVMSCYDRAWADVGAGRGRAGGGGGGLEGLGGHRRPKSSTLAGWSNLPGKALLFDQLARLKNNKTSGCRHQDCCCRSTNRSASRGRGKVPAESDLEWEEDKESPEWLNMEKSVRFRLPLKISSSSVEKGCEEEFFPTAFLRTEEEEDFSPGVIVKTPKSSAKKPPKVPRSIFGQRFLRENKKEDKKKGGEKTPAASPSSSSSSSKSSSGEGSDPGYESDPANMGAAVAAAAAAITAAAATENQPSSKSSPPLAPKKPLDVMDELSPVTMQLFAPIRVRRSLFRYQLCDEGKKSSTSVLP